jgi:signal transduction histidine kinase
MTKNPRDEALMQRGLDVVARNTRVQAQLIADLFDISRIVSGRLRLDIQRVDVTAVVREAIETGQQNASAKQITLSHGSRTMSAP